MRVNDDYADSWNVTEESKDPGSVLNFWKEAITIRKQYTVLVRSYAVLQSVEVVLLRDTYVSIDLWRLHFASLCPRPAVCIYP